MEKKEIIINKQEQSTIDKYVDGQISGNAFSKITDIYDKYKNTKTEDIYINFLQALFNDRTTEMFEFKKLIRKKSYKIHKKDFVSRKKIKD